MPVSLSVIICTHNPRADYLARTLEALRTQTIGLQAWELIIIDSFSSPALIMPETLGWHPAARLVRENVIGLTPARLCGIREACGDVLLFLDDDNVLAPDYLALTMDISTRFPMMGAWGGSIKGEFEVPPPSSIVPYLGGMAVHEISRAWWSNILTWSFAVPYGSGMCVRQSVAWAYTKCLENNPLRRTLDRSGLSLGSGGDTDMAWCSTLADLGMGRFPELKLTHLIAARRLTEDYVAGLYGGFAHANVLLRHFWNLPDERPGALLPALLRVWKTSITEGRMAAKIARACLWAERRARKQLLVAAPSPQSAP